MGHSECYISITVIVIFSIEIEYSEWKHIPFSTHVLDQLVQPIAAQLNIDPKLPIVTNIADFRYKQKEIS